MVIAELRVDGDTVVADKFGDVAIPCMVEEPTNSVSRVADEERRNVVVVKHEELTIMTDRALDTVAVGDAPILASRVIKIVVDHFSALRKTYQHAAE